MTMARLQRVYLYYSYAVFVVLLFTAWWQYQFALFLLLSFILLICNATMQRLARLAKNRYADYANPYATPMDATMPAALLYGLIVLAYLLFSELLTNIERFNWLLFAIWAVLILLPSLYFELQVNRFIAHELQVNRFIAQSLAAIRQPEKWSAGKKLLWLLHGLVPLGMAAFSFYSAFTLHDHSVMWLKVGFFTLQIGIFIYRYLLLHLGFEAA
nr:hypothetical protein [uncultured Kingella sp.]